MKIKEILSMLIVAIFGGVIAVFAYTRIAETGDESTHPNSSRYHHLSSFESHNIRDVSFPDLSFAAEKAVHCVVHVRVKSMQEVRNPWAEFFGQGQQRQQVPREGFGSGVIISPDGYIVTNNHVIRRTEEIEVRLNDGRVFTANIIGTDPASDVALLKIDETNLPFLNYGDAEAIRVGEWVLAVGNPLNLTSTVTAGIVSAKARNLNLPQQQRSQISIESFIQTDAAINQGNSGGALVNIQGELIGINTLIMSQTSGFSGNAFAIPSTIVEKVVADLKEYGVVQRALLGVVFTGRAANDNFSNEKPELFIEIVTENSGAAEAGIKVGDVLTSINDVSVNTFAEFQGQINKYRPNDKVKISVIRDKKTQPFVVTLRNIDGTTQIVRAENSEMILGATFEAVSQRERRELGIRSGVKVKDVGQGKLKKDLDISNGFIITAVNDKPVNSARDIQTILDEVEEGGRILINGVSSRGQVMFYALAK